MMIYRPDNSALSTQLSAIVYSWGRGIEKITDACEAAGLPEPIIEENSGGVAVELLKAPTSEGLGNQLGNTKELILAEMKTNPKISGAQLAELLDISTTAG